MWKMSWVLPVFTFVFLRKNYEKLLPLLAISTSFFLWGKARGFRSHLDEGVEFSYSLDNGKS